MEMFDLLSIGFPILLIIWFDIELDSRKAIKAANSDDPYPAGGVLDHFFEGIVVLWVFVLLFAANVFFLNVGVWVCIAYIPFLLGWRFFFPSLYFAFRVVVPRFGWSNWGHLGGTSGIDKLLRRIGFSEKNHYLVRIPVALIGIGVTLWLRFGILT